jgi:chemotaxis family two-component system sensor histidine kinase/response regulator PixL
MHCLSLQERPSTPCILVVDDRESNRKLLRVILGEFGYSVLIATNGIEALRQIETHPSNISLILSDYNMPLMDGAKLFWSLKQKNASVPMILLSGLPDWEVIRPMQDAGLKAFLQKPYHRDELIVALENALQ